jgi:uncharacterized protein
VIFVDSSYFVAIVDRKDRWHRAALKLSTSLSKGLLVSDLVIAEAVSVVGHRGGTRAAGNLYEFLMESCEVEYVDSKILGEAMNYYEQFDAHLGLSSCTSVAIMARRGVSKIVSFDPAFDRVKTIERVK